ncbi:coagulation factor XIII B chain-like isoform X2 [Rana temporaria]|uniref:coagulation factor XIII B chain-like isoform X2 n=1 Tax=Rana temporaria TaxID=8407 RepID=UPI001AAD4FD5|nr:coagulation factor XIII B chain-like isoform X2 [Rana temporaria]
MNSFLQNSFIINLFVRRMKSLGKYIFLIFLFIASCSGIPFAQENKQGICKVSNLENGNYVPNKTIFKIGEWLQYQCDDGYMTAQRNIVEEAECLLSGWSAVLQCSEIKCSVPPSTGFDKLHPVYSNGQVGKFSCDEGMILRGSAISQCYYYGWDPPLPVCEAAGRTSKCPPPPQPANTEDIGQKWDYFNGEKIQMKCKTGFKLHGPTSVLCQNDKWTSPPQCVRTLKCNKPPSIPFGTLDSATTKDVYYSGDVVIYKCSKDFEMNGEAESFCINGKWSLPPSCGKQGQNCLSPPFVANGEVKGIIQKLYTSGSILEYQCQKYYKAFGSLEITCRNGHWTETPVCLEPCTVGQRELFNNNIELKNLITEKHYFEHGQIIEFLCLPGYQLETSPSTLTTKCERGKLIYPKCAKKGSDGCAISKEIMLKNGVNLNNAPLNIAEGYTVEFQCVGNLVPEKTLSAKCNKGEIVYPQCIEQGSDSCQLSEEKIIQNNILLPRSASHRKVFKSGEMMLVRCKPGFFSISPPLQLKCLDRKLTYPKCTHEQPCRISQEKMDENFLELTTIEDNKVYFEDGANIHFACKPGFSSESDLIGLCFKQDILYPLCHKTVIVSSVAAT